MKLHGWAWLTSAGALTCGLGAGVAAAYASAGAADQTNGIITAIVGGAASTLGLLYRYWLRHVIRARREARIALAQAVALVREHVPNLVIAMHEVRAHNEADLELRGQAVMKLDASGHCVWVNQAWRRTTGYGQEEAEHWGWLGAVHPEDRARIRKAWEASTKEQRAFDETYRLIDRAKHETPMRSRATPVFGPAGTVLSWLNVSTIVTDSELKEALDMARMGGWANSSSPRDTGPR